MAANPSEYFGYYATLAKMNGKFYVSGVSPTGAPGVTVQDYDDGSGDDLTQLGDVTPDRFTASGSIMGQSGTLLLTYAGETPDGQSAVGMLSNNYVLFTDNTSYAVGDQVAVNMTGHFQIVCYATGTLIRVARDEAVVDVAVEALRIGDLAVTASGAARPIRWIGHRTIDCRAQAQPREAWPIRVAANAFGDGLPSADLFLSSGHAVQVGVMDRVLIPIGTLINGATIARHPVDEVTYWHVELDSHDVLIANGLPAESFLDCGNRDALLERQGEYDRLAGPHTPADFCLPFVDAGPVVEAVRARLAARVATLGWTTTRDVDLHLIVDGVRIEPDVVGNVARFIFPTSAQDVVLASTTQVPSDRADTLDHRRLGVSVHGLELDDGLGDRVRVDLDDTHLAAGWHPSEAAAGCFHRFTDGRLALPPALWAACRGQVVLRVHHDPQGAPRWMAPRPSAALPQRDLG